MSRLFNRSKIIMLSALAALAAAAVQGCQKEEAPVTELTLQSETLEVSAEGGIFTMSYSISNPVEGAEVEAACSSGWLHDFDCSKEGEISFTVDENPEVGQTRAATVTVSYNDGAIEKEFSVIQGEGIEKAPFDIEVTEIGMDYAVATITPSDPDMTWHALAYEAWVLDEDRTVDEAIQEFLAAYQFVASMAGMDFETFMKSEILVTGTQTITFDQLAVGADHYIMALGMAPDGTVLTDVVLEPFTTESIDMQDVTFDVTCDVDGPNVVLHTMPSDDNVRYYTDVKLKSDWADGPDIQGWIQTLIWRGSVTGKTREQVIEEISSYGKVDKEMYLNANTEYYAFAVAINDEGIVNSEATTMLFTTGDVPMSDNKFDLAVENVGVDNVTLHITPSNDDQYTWAVSPVSEWEGMTDEEYLDWYFQTYGTFFLDLSGLIGEQTVMETNLAADTEYYAFVFGYEQSTVTTGVTKVKFRTGTADNPEDLTFDFSVGNITPTSVDVKVSGTPETALYCWDVIDASATPEQAKETLDARVQRWIDIGYKANRAEVFQEMAVRGTVETTVSYYNFSYNSIEPGKEYKLYAVGIYGETGEYATDFCFSEPFTTPLQ